MANSKPGSKLIKAAGAVAWRPGPAGEPEILLVHRKRYDDWSLPKGKSEPGELLPITAVREVLEEGGARLALGRRLVSVRYHVGGRPKRVHYWAAQVAALDERAVPNEEVDEIAWVPAADAIEHVSYAHDHGVLADFARLPAPTVPLILLRHAKAVTKGSWSRADARRPLDDSGRADAKTLAELLSCFAPNARLITSPAARCVETLRPLAELSGADLREEPSLYVHHEAPAGPIDPADSARRSLAALVREAIAAGEPTILCAHRENIPHLQAAALAALGVGVPGNPLAAAGSALAAPGSALAAPGSALANEALAPVPELPKEWADALPTAGFWVLNLAPAPAEPASESPTAPPAPSSTPSVAPSAPGPSAPAPPVPARRRWFAFGWPARKPAPSVTTAPPANAQDRTLENSQPPAPPAPRLTSADRYDLTEP
jgi:8-oxo-(d)GTP phosphatase